MVSFREIRERSCLSSLPSGDGEGTTGVACWRDLGFEKS